MFIKYLAPFALSLALVSCSSPKSSNTTADSSVQPSTANSGDGQDQDGGNGGSPTGNNDNNADSGKTRILDGTFLKECSGTSVIEGSSYSLDLKKLSEDKKRAFMERKIEASFTKDCKEGDSPCFTEKTKNAFEELCKDILLEDLSDILPGKPTFIDGNWANRNKELKNTIKVENIEYMPLDMTEQEQSK